MTTHTTAMRPGRGVLWLGIIAISVLALVAAGWFAALRFQSPAQRAASAQPPAEKPVWATATSGTLADQASSTGRMEFVRTAHVRMLDQPANAVVTSTVLVPRRVLTPAARVAEVNGEPVFAFAGSFDFYRRLGLGSKGPDVRQLQNGLESAGFVMTDEHGIFGNATAAAVKQLYRHAGYEPRATLPLTALAVVPQLPATVISATKVGGHPGTNGALAEVGSGDAVFAAAFEAAAVARMEVRQPVSIAVEGRSKPVPGRVLRVPDASSDAELAEVLIAPLRPLSLSLLGHSAVVTVTVRFIAPHAVLVPSRALARRSGAEADILVQRDEASHVVRVRVLGELAGVSALEPLRTGELVAGDEVEVG